MGAADERYFSVLDWALPYDVRGATALWLALDRERSERTHFLRQVEAALPKPYQRMWQGRTAVLYTYDSDHSFKSSAPWGVGPTLDDLLADDCVTYFLAFQIGNWSVGGAIETMNPMADWIWKRKRGHARRPRRVATAAKTPKRPVIVEVRRRPGGAVKR